jgi:hypothetical protein
MPPQQRQRLADVVGRRLDLSAHQKCLAGSNLVEVPKADRGKAARVQPES